ncbi:BRCT domain [Dillenia turbinata]|uniref:RNA polymerase II C-terminal domain phosphatase-like n=1 Tax=Dillenia turbinata TaxID=194707 RepID=A0AAN8W2Z3_9MAGN
MSLVADTPPNSSSSDDFASLLAVELDSISSEASPEIEVEDDYELGPDSLEVTSPDVEDDHDYENRDLPLEGCRLSLVETVSIGVTGWSRHRVKRRKVEELEVMEKTNGKHVEYVDKFRLKCSVLLLLLLALSFVLLVLYFAELHFDLQLCAEASTSNKCLHPVVIKDICVVCGEKMEEASGVALGYIHKDLRLSKDELYRVRNLDKKNSLRNKKLYLVLDLDHTLLNSTRFKDMTEDEAYLKTGADTLKGRICSFDQQYVLTNMMPCGRLIIKGEIREAGRQTTNAVVSRVINKVQNLDLDEGSLFRLDYMQMFTKLRPFVHTFLKEANKMFEMYIYTMGEPLYAAEMARLLDPSGVYFSSRVISQVDCTQKHQKGLDVVLGQDSAVLILDDTENVWQRHRENLILMERYHYFASSCQQYGFNCKSLSELKSDERELDGALATILHVLKQVYSMYFDTELGDTIGDRDVRKILKSIRKEVLKGCKIIFSRVFPNKFPPQSHPLWKMAEQLGATCATEVDEPVTHVVAMDTGTEKSKWAVKQKKFLVHPGWLEATNYFWERQPEENFRVSQLKNQESSSAPHS